MAVVALAAQEETLGADRRNLRGSPCAVASGRVGGDDKNVNLTRFALDVCALRWRVSQSKRAEGVFMSCKKKTRAFQPHPLPPPPFPPLRIWSS